MLKGVDPLLSGELLRHLDELGHGDSLVLADRNFPAYSMGAPVVRVDAGVERVAEAVLSVLPLDGDGAAVYAMAVTGEPGLRMPNHEAVHRLARRVEGRDVPLELVPRFEFYERAHSARLVVLTREEESFNDFLLVKGVVPASS